MEDDWEGGINALLEAFETLEDQNLDNDNVDEQALSNAWDVVGAGARACVGNSDMYTVFRRGFITCIQDGFVHLTFQFGLMTKCLKTCCSVSSIERGAQDLIEIGVIWRLLQVIRSDAHEDTTFHALESLNNLASFPFTRSALIAEGVAQVCEAVVNQELQYYVPNVSDLLLHSLRAFSLLCKLYGKDEEGSGADLIARNISFAPLFMDHLELLLQYRPAMVRNYSWNIADMLQDLLLLVTADRNKPFLGHLVPGMARVLELQPRNPTLVSRAIQVLNQLMFEPSITNEFLQSKSRLLAAFWEIGPLGNQMDARNLSLLRRMLDDLKDPQEQGEEDGTSSLPEYPTHVFMICASEHFEDGLELVDHLEAAGYVSYFCGDTAEPHAIMEAYYGVVLLPFSPEPTINLVNKIDFLENYYWRQKLISDIFDWVQQGSNTETQIRIAKRSVFYPFSSSGPDDSIDQIAADVINRLSWFHADHFPMPEYSPRGEESLDQEIEDGEEEGEHMIDTNDEHAQLEGINQPEVMALVSDILTQMTNMQLEIQRLNAELAQLRSTVQVPSSSNIQQVEEEEE